MFAKEKRRKKNKRKTRGRRITKKEGRKDGWNKWRTGVGREIVRAVHCSFLLLLFVDTLALEQGNHADVKTGWFLGSCVFFYFVRWEGGLCVFFLSSKGLDE